MYAVVRDRVVINIVPNNDYEILPSDLLIGISELPCELNWYYSEETGLFSETEE